MYFHNKAAVSKATLYAAVGFVAAVAAVGEMCGLRIAVLCVGILLSAFLAELLCVRHTLTEGFTRMPECLFILLNIAVVGLLPSLADTIVLLLEILFFLFCFNAYHNRCAPGQLYFAWLFVGALSTQCVQLFFLMPFLWLMTVTWLQAWSKRNTAAMFFGLLTPYWVWLALAMYRGEPMVLVRHFAGIAVFRPLCEGVFAPQLLVTIVALTLYNVVGILYFRYHTAGIIIRTRMFHSVLHAVGLLATVFLILQPQHVRYLLGFILLAVSVSSAHYFARSKTRFARFMFFALLVLILCGTVVSLWNF